MLILEFLKNALLHICLALWLLPLLYVKFLEKFKKLNVNDAKKKGKKDFVELKEKKEKNNSPTPNEKLSKETLLAKIEFCKKELRIHKQNSNSIMIGFKTAELSDLEKQLK